MSEATDAPATSLFTGIVATPAAPGGVVTSVRIVSTPEELDPDAPDIIVAQLIIGEADQDADPPFGEPLPGAPGLGQSSFLLTWTETGNDTKRFLSGPLFPESTPVFEEDLTGAAPLVPVIAYAASINHGFEGSRQVSIGRTLVRVEGLGDVVPPELVVGIENGIEIETEQFSFSPTRHYFVAPNNPSRPRVTVLTTDELPSGLEYLKPAGGLVGGGHVIDMWREIKDHQIKQETLVIKSGTALLDLPPTNPPGGELSLDELLTWYYVLFGEFGEDDIDLLALFILANGEIIIEETEFLGICCAKSHLRDARPSANPPRPMQISIDHDLDPIQGAMQLYLRLDESIRFRGMEEQLQDILLAQGSNKTLEELQRAREQRLQLAAQYTAAIARAYISGIAMTNQGADLVLTLWEVAESDEVDALTVACAVMPFVSANLFKHNGSFVVCNSAGAVRLQLSPSKLQALQNAQSYTGSNMLAVRWAIFANAGYTVGEAKMLVQMPNSPLKVPTSRKPLRRNMLNTPGYGIPPGMGDPVHAHHVLPWELRQTTHTNEYPNLVGFTELGLDVNDPQYGRWAEVELHNFVHHPEHGNYNNWWKQILPNITDDMLVSDARQMVENILTSLEASNAFGPNGMFPLRF